MRVRCLYAFVVDVPGIDDEEKAREIAKGIILQEVQKATDNGYAQYDVYLDEVAVVKAEVLS